MKGKELYIMTSALRAAFDFAAEVAVKDKDD